MGTIGGLYPRRLSGMRPQLVRPPVIFLGTDTTTKGAWTNVYGSKGYIVAEPAQSGTASLPSGFSWSRAGDNFFDWSSTWAVAAAKPDIPGSTSTTFTTGWYYTSTGYVEIDQTTPTQYTLSCYMPNPDNGARTWNISISDPSGNLYWGPVAATVTDNGIWYRFSITTSIRFNLQNTSSGNGVLFVLALD